MALFDLLRERLLGDGRSQRSNSVSNQYFQAKLTLQITRDPVLDRSTGHGFSLTTNGPLLVRDVVTGTSLCIFPVIVFLWFIFKLKCKATERGYSQIQPLFKSRKNVREIFQSGAVLKKERSKYLIVDSIRIT